MVGSTPLRLFPLLTNSAKPEVINIESLSQNSIGCDWRRIAIIVSAIAGSLFVSLTTGLPEAVLTTMAITTLSSTAFLVITVLAGFCQQPSERQRED